MSEQHDEKCERDFCTHCGFTLCHCRERALEKIVERVTLALEAGVHHVEGLCSCRRSNELPCAWYTLAVRALDQAQAMLGGVKR